MIDIEEDETGKVSIRKFEMVAEDDGTWITKIEIESSIVGKASASCIDQKNGKVFWGWEIEFVGKLKLNYSFSIIRGRS